MPSLHVTTPEQASKDISSILVELEHNQFMLGLEDPVRKKFDDEKNLNDGYTHCIYCRTRKPENQFSKVFVRGEGICKNCWKAEDLALEDDND